MEGRRACAPAAGTASAGRRAVPATTLCSGHGQSIRRATAYVANRWLADTARLSLFSARLGGSGCLTNPAGLRRA
jgi:hypothetical protein